jgi:hypothetical protein
LTKKNGQLKMVLTKTKFFLVFSLNKFFHIFLFRVELETAPLSRSSEIKKDSLEPVSETQNKA